jgi:outer membrane lipoprotein-sorting protein
VKEGGDQRFYVHFQAPADVRRQAYLVWKHVDQDDDRWLYLPDLDLVKRVAAGDKRTSFVGSHFFYEDVSGRNVNADEHSILSSDERFYVLKNVPKDKDAVEFSWYKVYVDRKTFMPLKAIYYDKSAEPKPYRTAEAQEMQWIQDRLTVVKSRVQDQRTGGETVAQFSDVKYDLGLSDDLFSERYLRRPPKEARP